MRIFRDFRALIVAFLSGIFIAGVCNYFGASDNVVVVSYLFTTCMVALALGVFNGPKEEDRYDSIRHRDGRRRSYGQAAVFIGTAAVFMGTVAECEEVCDDLWHYGQQADVRALDGTETFDVL